MKNLDFFAALSSVAADCKFRCLHSSPSWNSDVVMRYIFSPEHLTENRFLIHVCKISDFRFRELYFLSLSVGCNFIQVSEISYYPGFISHIKFTPDELEKSVPFILGKFRNYSIFLEKFSFAAKVLDKEFFSCV